MVLGPGRDVEIPRHGHDRDDVGHALGEQHRQRAAAAVAEQHHLARGTLRAPRRERRRQARHHHLGVAPVEPMARIARMRVVLAGASEQHGGGCVRRHPAQGRRVARRRVGRDVARRVRRQSVALEIDVQAIGRPGPLRVERERSGGRGDRVSREAERAGGVVVALGGSRAGEECETREQRDAAHGCRHRGSARRSTRTKWVV